MDRRNEPIPPPAIEGLSALIIRGDIRFLPTGATFHRSVCHFTPVRFSSEITHGSAHGAHGGDLSPDGRISGFNQRNSPSVCSGVAPGTSPGCAVMTKGQRDRW